ncbi:MAG: sugar transferase [Clostridiales bacterium]|nr:sugar transferase [Clostridiales bacterium]
MEFSDAILNKENAEGVLKNEPFVDKENTATSSKKGNVNHRLTNEQQKYLPLKRAIDVVLSGGAIVVLSPVLAAISVAIKLDSPGPVLFKQKRVGKNKELFEIWKFRSMRTDTPKDMPTHMLSDPEAFITKTGRFLRKTSLDELPQIFNIFRGQMSIIGPRPALWNQDDLVEERDKYGANDVTPGLTGWAQINGRDELEIPVKAKFDGEYVEKMGLWMDIKCFLGTIGSVLNHDGVVEGGTGEMHKEGEKTGDGSDVLVSPEKINKEIRTGAAVIGAIGTTGIGALIAVGKHFLGKERSRTDKRSLHLKAKLIGGAAFISTAATVYTNIKRRSILHDNHLKPENKQEEMEAPDKIKEDSFVQKRILITGANSYIGNSVENWLNQTHGKYIVDTLDMIGDAWKDYDFSSYDVVYHVAGIAHADVGNVSEEQKKLYYTVNTDLAVETAKKSKEAGVKQFIFMSSMIVYSGCKEKLITAATEPRPLNFYGDSKWQADQKIRALADEHFKVVVLRPPMIYGKDCKGNYPELAKLASKLPVFPIVKNKRSIKPIIWLRIAELQ